MITLGPGENKVLNISLTVETASLSGVVSDSVTGLGIVGATVSLDGYSTTTLNDGSFQILDIVPGTYNGLVEHPDYNPVTF